jgi:uncharacterized membrane protein YgaE (UPF0421/DUF939 family)
MNEKLKGFLIYASKCITGIVIVLILAHIFHYKNVAWGLISVILILSPDGKDAIQLAVARIKANGIGAVVGLIFLWIFHTELWALTLAVVVSIGLCYLFKLEASTRIAIATTIIIMLHEEGKHLWNIGVERVIAVIAGCLLGLIITFIFHWRGEQKEVDKKG